MKIVSKQRGFITQKLTVYRFTVIFFILLIAACSSSNNGSNTTNDPGGNADTGLPGQALYESFCLECHGDGDPAKGPTIATPLLGQATPVTSEQIASALGIGPNPAPVQSMISNIESKGKVFTDADLNEIDQLAEFIAVGYGDVFPTPPPRAEDGPGLFVSFCAVCHGPDALGEPTAPDDGGNIVGCDATAIENAIADEQAMSGLQDVLSPDEIQLIGNWLIDLSSGNGGCGGD